MLLRRVIMAAVITGRDSTARCSAPASSFQNAAG
jgi:hypothetical protein